MKHLAGLSVAVALLLSGCAVNPVTGERDFALVSESDEIEQGRRFHAQVVRQYGVYDDPALQAYVKDLGQRLARASHRAHLKFEFTVLDSPEINAFALPGGYIYVTRGIMAYLDSEAELAGVLGHEIGHVTARHSVRQQAGQVATGLLGVLIGAATGESGLVDLSQAIGTGIVRGYGRDHELEADRLGAEYLHAIGHDPDVMLDVIGVLKDQETYEVARAKQEGREPNVYHGVFSTHPRNDERLKTVVRAARKLSAQDYRDANQAAYYRRIDGLAWGPSARHGVIDGRRFLHPELRFAIDLPVGWQIVNSDAFLQARDPDSEAIVQVGVVDRKADESLAQLLRRLTRDGELEVDSTRYGALAEIRVSARGGQQPALLGAIALDGLRVLTLLGTAPENRFAAQRARLLAVNESFTRLDQAAVDAIRIKRLRIVDAGRYPTFAALAQASALERNAEDQLRLLNRAYPDGDIRARARVKTVRRDD